MAELDVLEFAEWPASSRVRTGVIAAAGVVLIAVTGLAVSEWAGAGTGITGSGPSSPSDSFAVLRQPQSTTDRLPTKLKSSVQLDASRYLGSTPLGRHYVATGVTGHDVCLVTLGAANQSAEVSCAGGGGGSEYGPWLSVGPSSRGSVALFPDAAKVDSGWTLVGRNLGYSRQ